MAWGGPLMRSYELPNSNVLLAGVSGQVTDLRGTDPYPYAQGVTRSWLGGRASDPAQADFWTVAQPVGNGESDPAPWWMGIGAWVALLVLAVVLVGVGTYAVVTGD